MVNFTEAGFVARLIAVLGTAGALAMYVACSGDSTSSGDPRPAEASPAAAATRSPIVGTWGFVYDDARRNAVEAELAKEISDPVKLSDAKREAAEEAAASRIEFTAAGEFISRIGDKVLETNPFAVTPQGDGDLELSMTKEGRAMKTTARLHGDELVISDPRKGELTFRRVR